MLLPFKMGLGGVLGDGKQWISWMSLEDTIGGIDFVLNNEKLSGPINFVSPQPITNRVWTHTLGKVLHRPSFFKVPAFAAKIAFGEFAEAALLASTRVEPKVLKGAEFQFQDPEIEGGLRKILTGH
jgi:NAD dependent epimerase/dehydratase family enzyme